MILLIILLLIIGLLAWILISPVLIEIDTRVPRLELRWMSIGKAFLSYEGEWLLLIRVMFFKKTIHLESLKASSKKIQRKVARKKTNRIKLVKKIVRMIKVFRIEDWKLSMDVGDNIQTAWLYPLNYLNLSYGHLQINFSGENYFMAKLRSRPWKLLYASMR